MQVYFLKEEPWLLHHLKTKYFLHLKFHNTKNGQKKNKLSQKKYQKILLRKNGMNVELFQKNLKFQRPSSMLRHLYNINDKKRNNALVDMIKSTLTGLKDNIKTLSEKLKDN